MEKCISVLFGHDGLWAYATIPEAMDSIEALYRTFYVRNPFDELEDAEASYKLYEIEKWLNTALEQNKPAHRKVADITIYVH